MRKVNSSGVITTLAGTDSAGYNGDGPAALFAKISFPDDVAVDAAGNFFVADTGNNRIRKVTPAGVVSTFAGTGTNGFSGDGGPASSANLNHPAGVAVDGAGNVFIADTLNDRVRKVTPDGTITTVAGNGTFGSAGDGGPASIAQISEPFGLALDATGDLFIADSSNHRIRMVDVNGLITTVAGTGSSGFSGDGGPATSAQLNTPWGVAVDGSGNIFIADTSNNRVRKVAPGGVITTVAGTGTADFGGDDGPATSAQLNNPRDVGLNASGNLFVADNNNARIRMINPAGIITTVAGSGAFVYLGASVGDGGPATLALIAPVGMSLDGAGNLFIAADNRVRKMTFTGTAGFPAITGISPFAGTPGTVIPATITGSSLIGATAVTFSGSGVSASINAGGTATTLPITITIAGGAIHGLRNFNVTTPVGTSTAFSGFMVSDSTPRPAITSINPQKGVIGTSIPATIHGAGLTGATAVTFSGSNVTAAIGSGGTDTSLPITITIGANASLDLRTVTVSTSGGTSVPFNGFTVVRPMITGISPVLGTAGFTLPVTITGVNLTGATAATFTGAGIVAAVSPGATDTTVPLLVSIAPGATPGPRDLTVTAQGATSPPFTGFSVAALGPSGMITTFAGDGTTDFKGDGGPAIAAGLYAPEQVAVDAAGNVYISDRNHNRVRKVTLDGIITTAVGGGNGGDGGLATQAGISSPEGLAVDSSGNLFIMEAGNYRVRKVAPNGIISTVAGNGTSGFSGDGGPAISAQISYAVGITVDSTGNLFIADRYNNRIRKVAPNGIITTVAGNGTTGFGGDGGPATSASIYTPFGVAIDATGNLLIADLGNQRIRKVTPGGTISTIAGNGGTGFAGDGGLATAAILNNPEGIAIDKTGNIIFVDNGHIRKIDTSGTITSITGGGFGGFGFSGDGGPASSASLSATDVAVDTNGNLFISDFGSNRIRKVTYVPNYVPPARKVRGQITSQ